MISQTYCITHLNNIICIIKDINDINLKRIVERRERN